MGGIFWYGYIVADGIQYWQLVFQIHKVQEAVINFTRPEPDVHGKYQTKLEHQKEQPFQYFHRVGHKKTAFYRKENSKNSHNYPKRPMLYITHKVRHED